MYYVQSLVTDLSDITRIHPKFELYLKPVAKIGITVTLPKLKIAGQTISNWEIQQKLRSLCEPLSLKNFAVSKSASNYIKFDCEVNNKASVRSYVAALDGKSIKLSGFPEILRVVCSESKLSFSTRQDWDDYFNDATQFDETQPGERPDTVYMSNVPCKFFENQTTGLVSADRVKEVFSAYGAVRNIDIPVLDPYRSDVQAMSKKGFKAFSYDTELFFEFYVQFEDYKSFEACMSSFRNMKLVMKESETKAFATAIKVDFDRNKHLSNQSIRSRKMEKDKIEKLQRRREAEKKKEKEVAEERLRKEERKKLEAKQEQELRRQRREDKRKRKKKEKKAQEEAARNAYRIQMEERKLLIAGRRLEAIRLVTHLYQRVQREIEEKDAETKRKVQESCELSMKEKRRAVDDEPEHRGHHRSRREENLREQLRYKEHEVKSRILKRKLEEEWRSGKQRNTSRHKRTSIR